MTREETVKICNHCKKEYPATLEYFHSQKGHKSGLRSWCKSCIVQASKNYYGKNKEKIAQCHKKWQQKNEGVICGHTLKRRYGITLEQYDKMFEEQNGNCAICGLPELMRRLSVDHNHKTGEVRALLCHQCNLMIGHAHENPTVLKEAAEYLETF